MNKTMDIYIRNLKSGKEIDEMVAEKLFGWKFRKPTHGTCCTCQTCGYSYEDCICGYSQYIEKMWDVIEKMQSLGATMTLTANPDSSYWCVFSKVISSEEYVDFFGSAGGESAPLAICKAALLALI